MAALIGNLVVALFGFTGIGIVVFIVVFAIAYVVKMASNK